VELRGFDDRVALVILDALQVLDEERFFAAFAGERATASSSAGTGSMAAL
jgi:hypothetical protein